MSNIEDEEEFEYEEEPPQAALPTSPAVRRVAASTAGVQPARRPQARPVAPAPTASNPTLFYMIMGFMGAVIVGLLGLLAVLTFQRLSGVNTGAPSGGSGPPAGGVVTPAANTGTPPRMALAEFKTLYDDPVKRPIIVDVRAVDFYAQGHIPGAISVPQSDLGAQLAKLPKDKLIVAYCQ